MSDADHRQAAPPPRPTIVSPPPRTQQVRLADTADQLIANRANDIVAFVSITCELLLCNVTKNSIPMLTASGQLQLRRMTVVQLTENGRIAHVRN